MGVSNEAKNPIAKVQKSFWLSFSILTVLIHFNLSIKVACLKLRINLRFQWVLNSLIFDDKMSSYVIFWQVTMNLQTVENHLHGSH
jgi:hypothetical protein